MFIVYGIRFRYRWVIVLLVFKGVYDVNCVLMGYWNVCGIWKFFVGYLFYDVKGFVCMEYDS